MDHLSAQNIRATISAFFATRSRVVRLYNLPPSPERALSTVFKNSLGRITLWTVREEYLSAGEMMKLWAVFLTHDEACVLLSLSGLPFAAATALESDLEPFHKLRRFLLSPHSTTQSMLSVAPAHPIHLSPSPTIVIDEPCGEYYTLSTNPPNPKTSFRLGDWICPSPNCAAHNFGRNLTCIGCGSSKQPNTQQHQNNQQPQQFYSSSNIMQPRIVASPRFSYPSNRTIQQLPPPPTRSVITPNQPSYTNSYPQPQPPPRSMGLQPQVSGPPKTAHPLLTPSGRAFAIGGRVQNVSSDPLSPCIMYWPDNEPFPEQGQIRPSNLVGVPQPPILNTGNKGPISHQPGDWICKKCNYLNWRRRKVCQTCLPYAEGNGDSISSAVQAERIALLTSVLAQTQLSGSDPMQHIQQHQQSVPRTASLTPPLGRRPYHDMTDPSAQPQSNNHLAPHNRSVHRSQSHNQLGTQYVNHFQAPVITMTAMPQYSMPSPIYQTSGHRQPSPLYSTGPKKAHSPSSDGQQQRHTPSPPFSTRASPFEHKKIETPAPLLPSFLQDIVQSPSLSPTSTVTTTTTSSSDLPFEDEYEQVMNSRTTFPRIRGGSDSRSIAGSSDSGSSVPIMNPGSIWRLDGVESKNLRGFPLSNQQDLMGVPGPGIIGSGRKTAQPAIM